MPPSPETGARLAHRNICASFKTRGVTRPHRVKLQHTFARTMADGPESIFTPQQLMGHLSFSQQTLVGNWREDRVATETRLKDYVAKRDRGRLALSATSARLMPQLAPVELVAADPEGPPHYGDIVLIRSLHNDGVLAFSMSEKPVGLEGDHAFVSCAPAEAGGVARTAFRLLSFTGKQGPVCYDDRIVLATAGGLHDDEVLACLTSQMPGQGSQSSDQRVTLRVCEDGVPTYASVFTLLPARMDARLGLLRHPVDASEPIVLVHCQSGKRVAGTHERIRTAFGVEHVVTAQTVLAKGVVHQLTGEKRGKRYITGYGVKPEYEDNRWSIERVARTAARPPPVPIEQANGAPPPAADVGAAGGAIAEGAEQ